jgi:TP901 family phage tail tape measure protein
VAKAYAIEAVFKLIDNVTQPLKKVGVNSKAVSNALKNDFDKATKRVDVLGKSLSGLAQGAALASIAAIGAGIGIATKQFIDFDSAVTAASSKFKDVDLTTPEGFRKYQETLEAVGKKSREVAAITEYNAVDTAGALDKMAMAGLSSAQSMSLLTGTTNLATATGMDLTTAVDIATDSLGAFGMMSSDTGELSGNLDRLSDVMAKTTNMFNTDMAGMFEAIKKGAPTFASAGQSVEDFSALIGVLASSGIKGEEAGTQLRNMMLSLAGPTKEAGILLEELNITTKDAGGNYLDIIDIIGQFEKQTEKLGSAEKAAALKTIFGSRTITGMNILLAEGADKLRGYRTELENAGSSAENIANAMRGSIKNKIEILTSALTELGFKFVEAFQEKGVSTIEKITDAVSSFDPAPIVEFAKTAVDSIGKFLSVLGAVIKFVWQFRGIIIAVVGTLALYHGGLMLVAVASKTFAFWQGAAKAVVFLFTLATKGQAAALTTLKAGTITSAIATKGFSLVTTVSTAIQNGFTAALKFQVAWLRFFKLDIIAAKIAMIGHAAATQVAELAGRAYATTTAFLSKVFRLLKLDIFGARVSVIAHSVAIQAATAAQKVFSLITGGLSKLFQLLRLDIIAATIATKAQAFASKAAAVAQGILNAVMSANPIGLVIAAIVALIAIIILLVKNWDKVSAAISRHQNKIMTLITVFTGPFGFILSMIKELIQNWGQVTSAFKDGGILAAIKRIGGILLSGLLAPVQGLLEILALIPGIGIFAGKGVEKINELRDSLKGIDTKTVEAVIPEPVETAIEPPDLSGYQQRLDSFDMPDFEIPEFNMPDMDMGKVKLHGVYDINSNIIPSLPADTDTGTETGIVTAGATTSETIFSQVVNILARIDNSVSEIIRLIPNGAPFISDIPEKSVTPIHNETHIIQNMSSIPAPISKTRTIAMASSEPFSQAVNILARIDNSVLEIKRLIPNDAPLISGMPEKSVTPIYNETHIIQNTPSIPAPISKTVSTIINTITPDVTQTVTEISVSIKHIDSSIADILQSISSMSYIKIRDDNESHAPENPRNIAPVTQAERIAYSLQERRETVAIEVSAAKGTDARITRIPRDVNIQLVRSGGNL